MTDLQRRIIAAMSPGVRHSTRDLAEAVGWKNCTSKLRKVLGGLVDNGFLRKYVVNGWAFEYVLTPKGVALRQEIAQGGGEG